MHEVLYAMAGSNQCQLADPQHVEAISGNARQVFEDYSYIDRTALDNGRVEACYISLEEQKGR